MNAKKIMGAVLVALLAAALFIGAGAAAEDGNDYGTVYLYQGGLTALDGTWTNGDYTVTISGGVVLGENVVAGTYTKGKDSIYVSLPTATYSAKATIDGGFYAVMNGGKLYSGNALTLGAVATNSTVEVSKLYVTYPNGVAEKVEENALNVGNLALGTYKVQAIFSDEKFVDYVPENLLIDTVNSFTFTVVKAGDATITAAVDTVIVGDGVKLVITGQPGEEYTLVLNGFNLADNPVVDIDDNAFTMPNNGAVDIYVIAGTETGDKTVAIEYDGEEVADVSIEIVAGSITAQADADSYYIGNTIKLSGITTVSGELEFYIKGTNTELIHLNSVDAEVEADKTWTAEIKGTTIRALNLDAASYTIYVSADNPEDIDEIKDFETYTTVGVALKQPFISITEAPEVVIQGGEAKIKGTAEATDVVAYYIFGTNFFKADNTSATVKNGEFTVTLGKDLTEDMAAGQYFAVIQHKMYDNKFNIYAEDTKIILEPTTGAPSLLFNVTDRQKANAAEALCQALDTENIDDMYVKLSFVVAAPTSVINPIPAEVTQGTKLTVSGTATGLAGEVVTVEMLSTAFAAVPKNTVGSASFIALTTKVADDGTWEVTFDTAGLNIDEYTVTAAVGQFDATTTKVNVVEGAPVTPEQPDTPVTPEQPENPTEPEAPATPGFGALAALAGLGAVAVLLLRRE